MSMFVTDTYDRVCFHTSPDHIHCMMTLFCMEQHRDNFLCWKQFCCVQTVWKHALHKMHHSQFATTANMVFILTLLHSCTQIWFLGLLRKTFQPHRLDRPARHNQPYTCPPKQPLHAENKRYTYGLIHLCLNTWVFGWALTRSECVPVCSGRTLLCTDSDCNRNHGPRPPITSLQISLWIGCKELQPRCFHPQKWT